MINSNRVKCDIDYGPVNEDGSYTLRIVTDLDTYRFIYDKYMEKLQSEIDDFNSYMNNSSLIRSENVNIHKQRVLIYSNMIVLLDYLIQNYHNNNSVLFKRSVIKIVYASDELLSKDDCDFEQIGNRLNKLTRKLTKYQ